MINTMLEENDLPNECDCGKPPHHRGYTLPRLPREDGSRDQCQGENKLGSGTVIGGAD